MQKAINKETFRRQRHYVRDAQTVFDVGAWVGQTANGYRKLYPDARIYAFEPAPMACDMLIERFARDAGVSIYCVAMGDSECIQPLHINAPGQESSLLAMTEDYQARGMMTVEDVWVYTTTLDLFCKRWGIGQVDVLKLDVQGTEMRVLEGARGLFDGNQVGMVFTELNFWEQYHGQCWWHEVGAWLADYGFQLCELAPQWRQGHVSHANGVFAKGVPA